MKKFYSILLALTISALAFTSCSKDNAENLAPNDKGGGITVTLIPDTAPSNLSETRTQMAGNDVIWSDPETYNFYINDKFDYKYNTNNVKQAIATTGEISFTLNNLTTPLTSIDGFFGAKYSRDAQVEVTGNVTVFGINLPANQTCTTTTFDPSADALVMHTIDASQITGTSAVLDAVSYDRTNAITKLSFTGLTGRETEKVQSVEFATSTKTLAGGFSYDHKNKTFWDKKNSVASSEAVFVDKTPIKAITLGFADSVALDAQFVAWMVSAATTLPANEQVTVTIETDQNTITKTFTLSTGATFQRTQLNLLTLNMTGATVTKKGRLLEDGLYVVMVKNNTQYVALDNKTTKHNIAGVDVNYDGTAASFENALSNYTWKVTYANGGYSFQNQANNQYLYKKAEYKGHHNAGLQDTPAEVQLEKNSNGTYKMTDTSYEFFYSSDSEFTFDPSDVSKKISADLYIVPAKVDTTPKFGVPTTLDIMDSETTPATGTITLTDVYNPENLAVTATIDAGYTATVDGNTITITADAKTDADKTATLTVQIGTASKTVTINHKAYVAGQGGTMTIDLTNKNYTNGASVTTVAGTDPLSVVFKGAKFYNTGNAVRMYSKNTLTISGKTITKVVFTITTSNKDGKKDLKCGTEVINAKNNWTWENTTGVDSVVFTGTANHTGIQKITVTYK